MKKTLLALWLICVLAIEATAQDAVLSALTDIKTDIAVMKTDIAGMKTDIAVMKTDIAVIHTRLDGLEVDVQSIFDIGANIWSSLLIGLSLAGGLAFIKFALSAIFNKTQKEPNAIQSSSEPELAGLRKNKRPKARPAT